MEDFSEGLGGQPNNFTFPLMRPWTRDSRTKVGMRGWEARGLRVPFSLVLGSLIEQPTTKKLPLPLYEQSLIGITIGGSRMPIKVCLVKRSQIILVAVVLSRV